MVASLTQEASRNDDVTQKKSTQFETKRNEKRTHKVARTTHVVLGEVNQLEHARPVFEASVVEAAEPAGCHWALQATAARHVSRPDLSRGQVRLQPLRFQNPDDSNTNWRVPNMVPYLSYSAA